jgi:hypothetical protein
MESQAVDALFWQTWQGAEAYYTRWAQRPGHAFLGSMVPLVEQLRHLGLDHTTRLGHALYFLVLSRSLKHGLRPDQPFVQFWTFPNSLRITYQLAGRTGEMQSDSYTLGPELEELLRLLVMEDVD